MVTATGDREGDGRQYRAKEQVHGTLYLIVNKARSAPRPSGDRISNATREPVNCAGEFILLSSPSSGLALNLVTAITAIRYTTNQAACQKLLC